MSFQLEQSSVIKTAPPGRQLDFPKNEPLDLAPLTQVQDLSKMQTLEYPQYYQRAYQEYAIGLNQPTSALVSTPSQQLQYFQQVYPTQQEWPQQYSYQRTLAYNQDSAADRIAYKTVDMPSPVDSGIGADLSLITAKDEFFQSDCLERPERALSHRDSPIIIPKLHNTLGFQYVLEAPISTSIRKEDDRMTYVNKGQFYTVSLDYIPDPCKPLKSVTVKSQLMVVFREDKTYEEEMKTWQFWHSRQHSAKQRILEVDAKNSSGMIGNIEEIAHNGVAFYWNPSEQTGVKISVAVQCLSTDFSNQKGVKGLPLHIQVDTFDGENEKVPFHRGYAQIKVFCDKGAERKLRDEDKRAQKRRAAGRKKSEGEYHEPCERSEFYHMRELDKPAALYVGPDEFDSRYLDGSSMSYDLDSEPIPKRPRPTDRMMLYVRKRDDHVYVPLHVVPPSLAGLAAGVSSKFAIESEKVSVIYKRCTKGVTVKMDDEMVRNYMNEDTFVIEVEATDGGGYAVTLIEVVPGYAST